VRSIARIAEQVVIQKILRSPEEERRNLLTLPVTRRKLGAAYSAIRLTASSSFKLGCCYLGHTAGYRLPAHPQSLNPRCILAPSISVGPGQPLGNAKQIDSVRPATGSP